jgi:hypothetical protein
MFKKLLLGFALMMGAAAAKAGSGYTAPPDPSQVIIGFDIFDSTGGVIVAGNKAPSVAPYDLTLQSWVAVQDSSDTFSISFLSSSFPNAGVPSTISTGGTPSTGGTIVSSGTCSGWATTTLAQNDVVYPSVAAHGATCKRVRLFLFGKLR